jgi:hypothetical protein
MELVTRRRRNNQPRAALAQVSDRIPCRDDQLGGFPVEATAIIEGHGAADLDGGIVPGKIVPRGEPARNSVEDVEEVRQLRVASGRCRRPRLVLTEVDGGASGADDPQLLLLTMAGQGETRCPCRNAVRRKAISRYAHDRASHHPFDELYLPQASFVNTGSRQIEPTRPSRSEDGGSPGPSRRLGVSSGRFRHPHG